MRAGRSFVVKWTVVIGVLAVFLVTTGAAQATPRVTWRESSVAFTAPAGSTQLTVILFDASGGAIDDLNVKLTGPVGRVIEVDPDGIVPTDDGGWELPVTISVPADATGHFPGALKLRDGSMNLGPALPVRVIVADVDPSVIPPEPLSPSPDRIGLTPMGQPVVTDELVIAVSFDVADPDGIAQGAAAATGAQIIGSIPQTRLYQLRYPSATLEDIQATVPSLEGIPGIEFVSLNTIDPDPDAAIPDDTEWDDWDVANPGGNNWGLEWIDGPGAWDITTGSPNIRIAVVDTDNDEDHSDLDDNVSRRSRGSKAGGHGTHVAGTVCAEGNNDKGVTGVMWDCDLRFFAYGSDAMTAADAMVDAVDDGARVVNMSLQFILNNTVVPITDEVIQLAEDTNDIFGRSVLYAQQTDRDVLWVFAAGNESGRDVRFTAPGGLAARFPTNTMAVAAVGRTGDLAGFSNQGELISVAAPGVDIFSTIPRTGCFFGFGCDDNYAFKSGTSMAAPHVTGLAGLVITDDPSRTAAEVKSCIVGAATRDGTAVPGHDFFVIDAPGAIECAGTIDLPPEVDVVLAFDLTGSMAGVIAQAKSEITTAITDIASAAPTTDLRYAVVSYEDYPGFFDSTVCGSSYSATYGSFSDEPFRIDSVLTDDIGATNAAVNGLTLGSGADGPESYGRVLWEIAQADTGSTLGFRPDALKLIINFGDNVPHDTDLNEGVVDPTLGGDTGIDPGRNGTIDCGGDDIDFQDNALGNLQDAEIRLLHVDSSSGVATEPYWRLWTSLTGGAYTTLGDDQSLSEVIIELLSLIP